MQSELLERELGRAGLGLQLRRDKDIGREEENGLDFYLKIMSQDRSKQQKNLNCYWTHNNGYAIKANPSTTQSIHIRTLYNTISKSCRFIIDFLRSNLCSILYNVSY